MKITLPFLLLGATSLSGGCTTDSGTTWADACSCGPARGYEARSINLNFEDTSMAKYPKMRGYYGDGKSSGGCCHSYGEHDLEGASSLLNMQRIGSNTIASYGPHTVIAFYGVFLPDTWTTQIWISPRTNTEGTIIRENINSREAFFLSLSGGKLLLHFPPSDNSKSKNALLIESNTPIATDAWQHIALVVSKGKSALYINGVLDKQNTL